MTDEKNEILETQEEARVEEASQEEVNPEKTQEEVNPEKTQEEIEAELLGRYVYLSNMQSRPVEEKDIKRVLEEASVMYTLCFMKHGINNGAEAIAHCQIDDKDPLRFYVTKEGILVVNPVITRHTRTTVDKEEGCMSYPNFKPIKVQRYHKIEFEYQTISEDGEMLSPVFKAAASGRDAQIVQHELEHMNGYDVFSDQNAENCLKTYQQTNE